MYMGIFQFYCIWKFENCSIFPVKQVICLQKFWVKLLLQDWSKISELIHTFSIFPDPYENVYPWKKKAIHYKSAHVDQNHLIFYFSNFPSIVVKFGSTFRKHWQINPSIYQILQKKGLLIY